MKAEDVFGLLIPVTFVVFFVTERLFPRDAAVPRRQRAAVGTTPEASR